MKERKYAEYVRRDGSVFLSFVCESYGALGESALAMLARLSARAGDRGVPMGDAMGLWNYRTWAGGLISVAVQRGNSKLVDVALNSAALARRMRAGG